LRLSDVTIFLRVTVIVSNNFDISTLDYVSVSAQMQLQNAMRQLRSQCWRYAAVLFLGTRVRIQMNTRVYALVFFVCCVASGLCEVLVTRSEISTGVCLCLIVCDLGTSTNSHPSLQFGCSTAESNIKFTYRHSNCSRRLLAAPRQCGCFSRWNVL
jgi:hypothetical protein